ncbi:MAG: hypothetical protein ACFFCS_19910 [Candidatus Hodarchaeota archaeon]
MKQNLTVNDNLFPGTLNLTIKAILRDCCKGFRLSRYRSSNIGYTYKIFQYNDTIFTKIDEGKIDSYVYTYFLMRRKSIPVDLSINQINEELDLAWDVPGSIKYFTSIEEMMDNTYDFSGIVMTSCIFTVIVYFLVSFFIVGLFFFFGGKKSFKSLFREVMVIEILSICLGTFFFGFWKIFWFQFPFFTYSNLNVIYPQDIEIVWKLVDLDDKGHISLPIEFTPPDLWIFILTWGSSGISVITSSFSFQKVKKKARKNNIVIQNKNK